MFTSIVVVILLLIVGYRIAFKGKVGSISSGIGNAFFEVHKFLRPSTHTFVQAKMRRRQDSKQGDGDDDPPEMPQIT